MIIAHRGSSQKAPENTLAAVNLAWEEGTDAVEVDIHLTADEELVVCHDPDTGRTGDRNLLIKERTMPELLQVDMGLWKGEQWRNERLPRLIEVFESTPSDKKVFVEIKGGAPCLPHLKHLIRKGILKTNQITLMDFDEGIVRQMMGLFTGIEILWLYEFAPGDYPHDRREKLQDVYSRARHLKPGGVNVENVPEFDERFIGKIIGAGLKSYCWTVDKAERAAGLLKAGASGITTNRPGELRKELRNFQMRNGLK